MNSFGYKDTPEGRYHESRQRKVVAQGVDAVIDLEFWKSDDYRDCLERLAERGFTSLKTDNCLGATPSNGLESAWRELVAPIAEFTANEKERKFLLAEALKRIINEAFLKYGRFETPAAAQPPRKD